MSELSEEFTLEPEDTGQAESSLLVAIDSDEFVPVNEAEMQYAESIAATDQLMTEEQDAIRQLIIKGFPIDEIFARLNVTGEIGEDEMGDTAEFYATWVNKNLTPRVLAQTKFFVAGQVVQTTTEGL